MKKVVLMLGIVIASGMLTVSCTDTNSDEAEFNQIEMAGDADQDKGNGADNGSDGPD